MFYVFDQKCYINSEKYNIQSVPKLKRLQVQAEIIESPPFLLHLLRLIANLS